MAPSTFARALAASALLLTAACTTREPDKAEAAKDTTAAASSAHEAEPASDEPKVQPVVAATVVAVQATTFDETIDVVGVVSSHPGRVAQLAAPAPTRVAKVGAIVGQSVAAGAMLVEFEVAPFEAARNGAERTLEAAEKAQARAARLADAGVLPRKDAEVAQADLANAQAAAVTARRARELAVLRAPFAGVVTRQQAVLGASVDPSAPLVEIADPQAQDVLLTLSPADAARVRPGGTVTLFTGGSAGAPVGTAVARGRVADVGAAVDSAAGGVLARVTITSRERPLRFGETLVGRVAVGTHANAVVVPEAALVPTGEGYRVFVVDRAGVAHATDVQVGGRSATGVWIREGLTPGMQVVSGGAYGMDDGAKVAPVKK
jgi:RND family efflux transporter MFP subunit